MDRKTLKRLNRQAKRLKRAAEKSNRNQLRTMQRGLKDRRHEFWREAHAGS